jgi:DNA-binding NarL/FixJ family response regulator
MIVNGEAGDQVTRCLIADDQAMVREGFAAVLDSQPGLLVVGQAADGAEAVRQARDLEPDVILMDVRMPVMDGLRATREILAAVVGPPPRGSLGGRPPCPAPPRVLMLTTFDLDEYVYAALRAGASGFLLKDATAAELIHAVRVVAAGDALLAPSVTRRLIADFARQPRPCPPFPSPVGALTQRETEVLRLIARGLSNTEISATLVIAEQTTKTHVGRILAKLGLRDRAQAVVLAYESGLVTPGGDSRPLHRLVSQPPVSYSQQYVSGVVAVFTNQFPAEGWAYAVNRGTTAETMKAQFYQPVARRLLRADLDHVLEPGPKLRVLRFSRGF